MEVDGSVRTLGKYKEWVARLATREYADELVIVAVALELKVRIVCVPFTPPEALDRWAISTYPGSEKAGQYDSVVYLGNYDVHYMWFSPST